MKNSKIFFAVFTLLLVVSGSSWAAILENSSARINSGNCALLIKTPKVIIDRVYAQSELIYHQRLALTKQQGGIKTNQNLGAIPTTIIALDVLVQSNLGGGAVLEPLYPQWFLDMLEPEFAAYLKTETKHVVVRFKNSPKIKKTVDGLTIFGCDASILQAYNVLVNLAVGVEQVEEMPTLELMNGSAVESQLPANRPLPNDSDFEKQWDRFCSGQTITIPTSKGDRNITCKSGASDINYLVGSPRSPKYKVVVFNIDTGFYLNHPDADPKQILFEYAFNAADGSDSLRDPHGHGTHTGGIFAQTTHNKIFGVGPINRNHIFFAPVKMFDDNGATDLPMVLRAVSWPVNAKLRWQKEGKNFLAISNNSWGFAKFGGQRTDLPELRAVLLANLQAGIPFINAAGNAQHDNNGYNFLPQGWAKEFYLSVRTGKIKAPQLLVGASYFDGNVATFSSFGSISVAGLSPGCPIYSLLPPESGPERAAFGSDRLYGYYCGTSMSSPIDTLAVAELMVVEGESIFPRLWDRRAASSKQLPRYQEFFGGGILDFHNFVNVADDKPSEVINRADFQITTTFRTIKFLFKRPRDVANDGSSRSVGHYQIWESVDDKPVNPDFSNARRLILFWPDLAKEQETFVINKLQPSTAYNWALEAIDKGGNSNLTVLEPIKTSDVFMAWLQASTFSGGSGFDKTEWQFKNLGKYNCGDPKKCPELFHLEPKEGNALLYRVPGKRNFDTSPLGFYENEGEALAFKWQRVSKDGVLQMTSARNTGLWYLRERPDRTRYWDFVGDYLVVFVNRKNKPSVELAKLPATRVGAAVGLWVNEEFSLSDFEGEEIQIGFRFKASEETSSKEKIVDGRVEKGLNYHILGGVRIGRLAIIGSSFRDDPKSLPQIPNGSFEKGDKIPDGWLIWPYCAVKDCSKYDWPQRWFGYRWTTNQNDKAAEGTAALRLENKTENASAITVASNDLPISIPASMPLELSQQVRINGKALIAVIGYDKKGSENWLATGMVNTKSLGANRNWQKVILPFKVPPGIEKIRIRYALFGQAGNPNSFMDVDDVKINFQSLFSQQ